MYLITLIQNDDGYYCQIRSDRFGHIVGQTNVRLDRDLALEDADEMSPGAQLIDEIDLRHKGE